MERWRSDRGTGRKGFHGRFRLGKGGNNASGCGDAPADDGEDGGQADGHREVSGDRRDGGLERRVGRLLHGATRPTPAVVTQALFGKFIRAHFLSASLLLFIPIFGWHSLTGKPSFSLWLSQQSGSHDVN